MKTKKILLLTFLTVVPAIFSLNLFSSETPALKEDELQFEDWMATPFNTFSDQPLEIEEWMTKPFEIN